MTPPGGRGGRPTGGTRGGGPGRPAGGSSRGAGGSGRGAGGSGRGAGGSGRGTGGGRSGRPTGPGRPPQARDGGRDRGRGAAGAEAGRGPAGPPARRPAKERGLGGTQVEGRHAVRELLLAGRRRVREVLLAADVDRSDVVADIVDLAAELRVPVTEVSRGRLDSLSRTDAPQGVVALAAEVPETPLEELAAPREGRPPFLLAADGVTDPGNLGALLRIAECAGVTGVVLPKHRAVHLTPTVTKAAAGAVEHLPMTLVGGLPTAIEELKAADVWVVGLDAGGDVSVHDLPVAGEAVCLVLGAEGKGLSRLVRQRCDVLASIPLHGHLASLNVASAGAIACYELARRRSA